MYLSGVMDGTGLGTDVLLVLFELLVPWFCCSDCICSAAEYNVDSFLEHTWARTLARVWDITIWSTYWKKNGVRKIKIWPEMQTLFFFSFFCVQAPSKPSQMLVFLFHYLNTSPASSLPPPPPPTHTKIKVALISQKLNQWSLRKTGQNLYVMGKLPESCVCKKWAVRTKQKPNCTLSKRGIRYFSNKSSAFLLLSNKSNSHWRNSCLSRRLS